MAKLVLKEIDRLDSGWTCVAPSEGGRRRYPTEPGEYSFADANGISIGTILWTEDSDSRLAWGLFGVTHWKPKGEA